MIRSNERISSQYCLHQNDTSLSLSLYCSFNRHILSATSQFQQHIDYGSSGNLLNLNRSIQGFCCRRFYPVQTRDTKTNKEGLAICSYIILTLLLLRKQQVIWVSLLPAPVWCMLCAWRIKVCYVSCTTVLEIIQWIELNKPNKSEFWALI